MTDLARWRSGRRSWALLGVCSTCFLGCSDNGTAPSPAAAAGTGTDGGSAATVGGSAVSSGATAGSGPSGGTGQGESGSATGGAGGDPTPLGGSGGAPPSGVTGPMGTVPNAVQPPNTLDVPRDSWQSGLVSPTFANGVQANQPIIFNGYLLLNGNCHFFFYDISNLAAPKELSTFASPGWDETGGPKKEGEAESHQVSLARYGDTFYEVTTAGKGVDIWNISDPTAPKHVKQIDLEGINYGDFTDAVWGLNWQGETIYVGGTNTGLHVLDAADPENVTFVKRIPTSAFGGMAAGPLWAVGNTLVITTPKESAGIATLDISDPKNPIALDFIVPTAKSYIGSFYGRHLFLQDPLRAWDVLTDPTDIGDAAAPKYTFATEHSEYMSFGDGSLFLGHALPNPGVTKIDLSNLSSMKIERRVWGRMNFNDLNDDQFSVPIGNLLVLSDDQAPYFGSVVAAHAEAKDTKPPAVDTVVPNDGATGRSRKSRVGITFTDNPEFTTIHAGSFIVRPMGGQPLPGKWGIYMGVVNFDPDGELEANTTYEVVLPAGGIKDYVGNGIAAEFKSTFTTGN